MPSLNDILIALRFQGLRNMLRSLSYTIYRDWLNWRYRLKTSSQNILEAPGDLQDYHEVQKGVYQLNFSNLTLELKFLNPVMIRIRWNKINHEFQAPVPYAIYKTDWDQTPSSLVETSDGLIIRSEEILVHVFSDGSIHYSDKSNKIINKQYPPDLTGNTWRLASELSFEECVFGLGEQSKSLNLRGTINRMWNTDAGGSYGPGADPLYMPLPVYMGIHHNGSYLIFHENPFPGVISFGEVNTPTTNIQSTVVQFQSPNIQYYFASGKPADLLETFTELTGRPPLPPLWSLGYHQSRWGYENESDVRIVANGFENQEMPLSAIHLDIDYMFGYRVFTVDRERFPNLSSLAQELQDKGIRLISILDPGVKVDPDYDVYKTGLQQGTFCKLSNGKVLHGLVWPGWSVYPDFTNPKAREWWKRQYKGLFDFGINGIWHDMNEPTSFAAWGGLYLPEPTAHSLDGRNGDHLEAHNNYALQMNRSGYEAYQEQNPNKRPWLLSRSGWIGNQRYAWNWTGDTESTWEALKMTIRTILGLGLSGIAYSGSDIGGFSGDPSPELYLRWFQMACFMPFFRTHSAIGTPQREPYSFEEPYKSILRRYLQLRYELLPYIYTLAWEASQTGAPLVRPCFWGESANPDLWNIDDQFLFGNALLVAPITDPSNNSRHVYLPSGDWYDFWDDKQFYKGQRQIEVKTELDKIPVYVRSGSIFPSTKDENLVLSIYPPSIDISGANGHKRVSLVYSDEGDGYETWRLDRFEVTQHQDELIVKRTVNHPDNLNFYPFPYDSTIIQLKGLEAENLWVDGQIKLLTQNGIKVADFNNLIYKLVH